MIVDPTRQGADPLGHLHQVQAPGEEKISIPKAMGSLRVKPPSKGVDLKGKNVSVISGQTKTNVTSKRVLGRGAALVKTASMTPPEGDDMLDEVAELFTQKHQKKDKGVKALSGRVKKQATKENAGNSASSAAQKAFISR